MREKRGGKKVAGEAGRKACVGQQRGVGPNGKAYFQLSFPVKATALCSFSSAQF